MRYVLCIFFPPIAVITTGKVGAFFLCILLTLLGWIPGMIYAILVVNKFYADRRHEELMRMQALHNHGAMNINIHQGYYPPQNPYPHAHHGNQYPQHPHTSQHQVQHRTGNNQPQ